MQEKCIWKQRPRLVGLLVWTQIYSHFNPLNDSIKARYVQLKRHTHQTVVYRFVDVTMVFIKHLGVGT